MKITAPRKQTRTTFSLLLYLFCTLFLSTSYAQDTDLGSFIFGIPQEAGKTKHTNYIFYFKILIDKNTKQSVIDEVRMRYAPNFDSTIKLKELLMVLKKRLKLLALALTKKKIISELLLQMVNF